MGHKFVYSRWPRPVTELGVNRKTGLVSTSSNGGLPPLFFLGEPAVFETYGAREDVDSSATNFVVLNIRFFFGFSRR